MGKNYDIGARIGLDGEQEFRNSLKLVNGDIKALGSALRAESTAVDENGKSMASAAKQSQLLATQVDAHKGKVNLLTGELGRQKQKQAELKTALDDTKNSETATADEVARAQQAYVNQSTAVDRLENELNNATTALHKSEKALAENGNAAIDAGKKWEEAGERVSTTGQKISGIGRTLAPASALAAAGLVASAKAAIDFESAFTGVEKTVDGTTEQMAGLRQGIIDMSKVLPSSTTEIAAVAETAGQLGIETDNVLGFTRVMIDLGNASKDLGAEEAATELAQFANITQMAQTDFDRLGSSITWLGNKTATSELAIVSMGKRLAGAGEQIGMSEADIMGIAAGLASLGIEAEAGGSAFTKVMRQMAIDVELGSGNIENFAEVAGMSVAEFSDLFKKDATKALTKFIEGLGDTEKMGMSTIAMLDTMGITELRVSDALSRTSGASNILTDAIKGSNKAWEENTALTDETNELYGNTASQLTIAKNKLVDSARVMGEMMIPTITTMVDKLTGAVESFNELDDSTKKNIINVAGFVAVAAPAATVIGKITTATGGVITGVGKMTKRFSEAQQASSTLGGAIGTFLGPAGIFALAATGVTILGVALYEALRQPMEEANESAKIVTGSMAAFHSEISSGQSGLSSYSTAFSGLNQEQQALKQSTNDVQSQITAIFAKYKDERAAITAEDVLNLQNYYTQMNELNAEQLALEEQKTQVILNTALQRAEINTLSHEAYKLQAANEILTLQEQLANEAVLLKEQYTTRMVYQQQRLDAGEIEQAEYDTIMLREQERLTAQLTNNQNYLGQTYAAYAEGYTQRILQDEGFKANLSTFQAGVEAENTLHQSRIAKIESDATIDEYTRQVALESQEEAHKGRMIGVWNQLTSGMSKEQQSQIGNMIAFAAETEMYGGEVDKNTKAVVDSIVENWNALPEETKGVMGDVINPMLEEMKQREPELFGASESNGFSIISGLKSGTDEHSPSKAARQVGEDVINGAMIGLDNKSESLFAKARSIAQGVIDILNKAFDRHSPSRVTREMFEDVGEGAILGLENKRGSIISEVAKMGGDAVQALKDSLSTTITADPTLKMKAIQAEADFQQWFTGTLPMAVTVNNTKNITIKQTNNWGADNNRNRAASVRALNRELGELL